MRLALNNIHFAIIGCGRIAIRHIEAIQRSVHAKLAAVCDINIELAREKAALANVPYYQNYHDMLRGETTIDVVIILTPSGMHFKHAMDIIKNYNKHIVIEKPFVLTLSHAAQLKAEADRHNVKIFPVYQNRFNKAVKRVKQALSELCELGKLRVGTVRLRWCRPQRYYDLSAWRGTWAMDGGAFTNQGIHYIDLLRYLCGEVKQVHAKLATLGADIEVEDTGVAIIEFKSGALGIIEIMTSARSDDFEASVSCVCENGLAVLGGIATNHLQTFSPDPSQQALYSEEFPTPYGFGHNEFIQGVVDTLQSGKTPLIGYDDGLQTLKLLHALYKSDEINGWVTVDDAGDSMRLGNPDPMLSEHYETRIPV